MAIPTKIYLHKNCILFESLIIHFLLHLFVVQKLTKGPNNWSLSEIVHAIVLLTHIHSLSSFVFSCGLTQDLDPLSSQRNSNKSPTKENGNVSPASRWGFHALSNSNLAILGIINHLS